MSEEVVYYRGSVESVKQAIEGFAKTLAGNGTVGQSLAYGVQMSIAGALLDQVQHAFVEKSRGGTGSDGIKWKPLKRETIAQRRIGKGDLAAIGIKGAGQPKSRVRGLLTKDEDKRWRAIFASTKAKLMAKFGMGEGDASARAAQTAWAILKSQGAHTKLEVLGGRTVDILNDTTVLQNSLGVGVEGLPNGAEGQIVRITGSKITVGTNVKTWHHNTKANWRRQFWPDGGQLPDPWRNAIERTANKVVPKAIAELIRSGGT